MATRTDTEIKKDVEAELRWNPSVDDSDVAVAVKNGVVALTGYTKSFSEKWEAERAVKHVAGVVGVANDIEVRLPGVDQRPDPDIARDAVAALKSRVPLSADHIQVTVKNGWVNLEGEVEWQYQRESAETAVRWVRGVKGVSNLIQLKPRAAASEIKAKIDEAFQRSAEVDANRILVEANGSEVVLKGTVRSWAERQQAERVAWAAPGVTRVDNRITISL